MNLITPLLAAANVRADCEATSKKRLFEQAAQIIQTSHNVPAGEVFDSLFSREKLGSTALGYGIAIPHARLTNLDKPFGLLARLKRPIEFDAIDGRSVDLVFLLLQPAGAEIPDSDPRLHPFPMQNQAGSSCALVEIHAV